jgi:hypothetical protein
VDGHAVFAAADFGFLEKTVGLLDVVKILFDCVGEQDEFLAVAESTSHSFKPRFVSECFSVWCRAPTAKIEALKSLSAYCEAASL